MSKELIRSVFSIKDQDTFKETALEIFRYQAMENPVYKEFLDRLGVNPLRVSELSGIPFLPVVFFRSHKVITGDRSAALVFESSGTTGVAASRHYVHDAGIYEESYMSTFRLFYGEPSGYIVTALLPSYTERKNSSLVCMMDGLISKSTDPHSGFYRDNIDELIRNLKEASEAKKKSILVGVSFALLDLAADYSPDLSGTIVIETGGMKGRRREITRQELHAVLKERLNIGSVHSEYGMTELLSQAYSKGDGIFQTPPWMKILIRDPHDPLSLLDGTGRTGGINIIDLANIHSCSFIATSDLGMLRPDGGFEVLGRFDESDIRGCNLLAI